VTTESLVGLALIGSRARGFHHDIASKLQALMMALDEIGDLAEESGDPTLRRAAESASEATRELHVHLQAYRALAKPAAPTPTSLKKLVEAGAARAHARVSGDVPDVQVTVLLAGATQAIALACETLGGPRASRTVRVRATGTEIAIAGDGPVELPLADVVAIVSAVLPARLDGNELVLRFG